MKNILFLMLVMGVFSPLINAYDLFIARGKNNINEIFYLDISDKLYIKRIVNGNISENLANEDINLFLQLSVIKFNPTTGSSNYNYVDSQIFNSYLKDNVLLLNNFYTDGENTLQAILNYFYNENIFSQNHIYYENYEILYNDQGLAVESIVNGVWAGLYDDDQKQNSGKLYNSSGELVYKNGVPPSDLESIFNIFDSIFFGSVRSAFYSLGESMSLVLFVMAFLVLGGVFLILNLLVNFLSGSRRRGWGSSRSESVPMGDKVDYGIEDSPDVIEVRRSAIAGIKQKMRRNGLL